jgi:hypothetical protein
MASINQLIKGSTILYQELLCTKLKDIYICLLYVYMYIYIYCDCSSKSYYVASRPLSNSKHNQLRSNLPRLLPHMRAGIAPLLRLYILFLYVYRRSPRQWPASETLLSFRAAGRTLRCRRRAWDSAPTSAPESLALLHARNRFLRRYGCLLSGLGSTAAAISLPDRTTSSRTRRSFRSCRTRWRPSSFGIICIPPCQCG